MVLCNIWLIILVLHIYVEAAWIIGYVGKYYGVDNLLHLTLLCNIKLLIHAIPICFPIGVVTCQILERYDQSKPMSRGFPRFGGLTSYGLVNRGSGHHPHQQCKLKCCIQMTNEGDLAIQVYIPHVYMHCLLVIQTEVGPTELDWVNFSVLGI